MIDMHMHTTYSDGEDNLEEIINKIQQENLKVVSITDHNTCEAYKNLDIKLNFKIITGCEFTTSHDNYLIEVLAYGFNLDKVNEFLDKYYNKEYVKETTKILVDELIEKLLKLDFIIDKEIKNIKYKDDFFTRPIYEYLIKNKYNEQLFIELGIDSFSAFHRKGIAHPYSVFFVDKGKYTPNISEIVEVIHNNGGIVFLAHPFKYNHPNIKKFISDIYNKYNLDGIECFYSTFTNEEVEWIKEFAEKNNLLLSGGSDYHGSKRKENKLGYGSGEQRISKEIIDNWNIKQFN